MPIIINSDTGKSEELKEGELITKAAEKIGVPFGCQEGVCGTCMIELIEGENNLSELTKPEIYLKRNKKHRLACQCRIKNGDIKIRID
ncbi:MAG: 2Fe-2S iron-sulfur cluster binding domain-containing protein [Candidatus Nanoarchaeia archaeon]